MVTCQILDISWSMYENPFCWKKLLQAGKSIYSKSIYFTTYLILVTSYCFKQVHPVLSHFLELSLRTEYNSEFGTKY